jgi:TonB family protein
MTCASGSRRPWWVCLMTLLALGVLASCEASPSLVRQRPDGPPPKPEKTSRIKQKALGGQPLIKGSLSREEIQKVIRANLDQIVQCYQQELRPSPNLASKVVVRFVIGPDGGVTRAEVKKTTLADPRVESCMLEKIRAWGFPKPPGGGIVDVTYPFVFMLP